MSTKSDTPVYIEFSVKLSNGDFSSHIRIPFGHTEEQRAAAVAKWLLLMQHGLKHGFEEMHATLDTKEPENG